MNQTVVYMYMVLSGFSQNVLDKLSQSVSFKNKATLKADISSDLISFNKYISLNKHEVHIGELFPLFGEILVTLFCCRFFNFKKKECDQYGLNKLF